MARTKLQYTLPFNQTEATIKNILLHDGYREINRNNEIVWKKGNEFLTEMQFIKVEYGNNFVNISGWVQSRIGNIGGKEMDLNDFIVSVPKRSILNVISKIQNAIC